MVILQVAIIDKLNRADDNSNDWNNEIFFKAKKCKPNSLKSFDHHGTKGFNYSFGNKPLYGMSNGSSVGMYQNKRSKNDKRQSVIDIDACWLQSICGATIKKGISRLSTIIPEIKLFLCPIVNAAYQMQSKNKTKLLHTLDECDAGFWNAFLFVDGQTEQYHTEPDCAYTFITVPQQIMRSDRQLSQRPFFIFKVDEDRKLFLPLTPHLAFMYNANFLTHRQSYVPLSDKDEPRFYNISSYSNEKSFNHLRQSFHR